jgi:hypothetical protein
MNRYRKANLRSSLAGNEMKVHPLAAKPHTKRKRGVWWRKVKGEGGKMRV